MRLPAGWLTAVLGLVSACGSASPPQPPAIESHLQCAASLRQSLIVDHDGGGQETRSPDEQAEDYGEVVGGVYLGRRKVAYRSPENIHIAFTDGEGRVKGVLAYSNHGLRGWWLTNGADCA